jgi:hypothetical protein
LAGFGMCPVFERSLYEDYDFKTGAPFLQCLTSSVIKPALCINLKNKLILARIAIFRTAELLFLDN